MRTVFLGQEDGTAALRARQAKVARGEPLTAEDRVGLTLWPLMRQSTPLREMAADEHAVGN